MNLNVNCHIVSVKHLCLDDKNGGIRLVCLVKKLIEYKNTDGGQKKHFYKVTAICQKSKIEIAPDQFDAILQDLTEKPDNIIQSDKKLLNPVELVHGDIKSDDLLLTEHLNLNGIDSEDVLNCTFMLVIAPVYSLLGIWNMNLISYSLQTNLNRYNEGCEEIKASEKVIQESQSPVVLEHESTNKQHDIQIEDSNQFNNLTINFMFWNVPECVILLHQHLYRLTELALVTGEAFKNVKEKIFIEFKQCCSHLFKYKLQEPLGDYFKCVCLRSYYVIGFMSLSEMQSFLFSLNLDTQHQLLLACCFLANNSQKFVGSLMKNLDYTKLEVKKEMLQNFLKLKCRKAKVSQQKKTYYNKCKEYLRVCYNGNVSKIDVNQLRSEFSNSLKKLNLEVEGNIYDRKRDPPGQRSVYIPPGDPAKESYRLSTFIKFPETSPVNPRTLASVGFFYTGYKDRVKCFSCGLCAENWVVGDDVKEPRWHKEDCLMMLNQPCGNVPIATLFSHLGGSSGSAYGQLTTESTRASAANVTNQTVVPNLEHNNTTTAAGILLGGAGNSNVRQTARPVNQPQQVNSQFPKIKLATIPSVHHEQLIRSLQLYREADRVKTFRSWPADIQSVFPGHLAKSGFFYLGNIDRVQCFSCGGVLRNWNPTDDVDSEHLRHFPSCRMALGTDTRNIALPDAERAVPPAHFTARATEPPDPSQSEQQNLATMFPCLYPVNPSMRLESARLESFDYRWPSSHVRATPRQISKAGFFFLGERDRVKCWYCNGGLQNWDPTDEPWTEHAKWFPTCEFLLQRKGPEFVHRIVAMYPNLRRPILRNQFDPQMGGSISRRARRPSPPPPIIDPQVEMQRARQQLNEAMNSTLVQNVQGMGFSQSRIRQVIKRKLQNGGSMYSSADALIEDLNNAPNDDDDDDEEEEMSLEHQSISTAAQSTNIQTPGGEASIAAGMDVPMDTEPSLPEGTTPSMAARIRELQDERKCKICLDKLANIVFVPCGHLCTCADCAQALRKCPICRVKIEKAIRTYMS